MSIEEIGAQSIEQDTSLAGAVDAMPDIEMLERGTPVGRADGGQFKALNGAEQAEPNGEPDKTEPEKAPAEAKADEAEEDDYIELAAEADGAEPTKIKLTEAIERYQQFEKVQAELAEAKKAQPPPEHYEQAIAKAHEEATQYLNGLKQLEQWMQPPKPNPDLVNPNSQNYNPELYHQQLVQAEEVGKLRAALRQEAERVEKDSLEKNRVVLEARMHREKTEAAKIWPELADPAVRAKVTDEFSKAYRFTPDEVKAIGDHRVLAVMKDALAYRASRAKTEAAVKVVTAKPKLVRAQARNSQTGKQAVYAAASDRLSKSNSLEDAADAIGALLG